VAIEEVVAGQVFTGRRTSLRAGSASQVFAGSRTASEDKDAGHRPGGSARVGHAFKTGVEARAPRRVRFPSASATRSCADQRVCDQEGSQPVRPEPRPQARIDQLATPVFAELDKSSFLLVFRGVLVQRWERLTGGPILAPEP
jgi:hypothetical protein